MIYPDRVMPLATALLPLAAPSRHVTAPAPGGPAAIDVRGLNFYYGLKRALEDITLAIQPNVVTAFIGPSGCGKSTFLRTLNRMNDIIAGTRVEGQVLIDGQDIYGSQQRRRRPAAARRHGVPEVEPVSRSRSSTTSPTACAINGMAGSRAELHGRVEDSLQGRRALGRGQGPAARHRPWRSRAGSSSGSASPGRSPSSPRSS